MSEENKNKISYVKLIVYTLIVIGLLYFEWSTGMFREAGQTLKYGYHSVIEAWGLLAKS